MDYCYLIVWKHILSFPLILHTHHYDRRIIIAVEIVLVFVGSGCGGGRVGVAVRNFVEREDGF